MAVWITANSSPPRRAMRSPGLVQSLRLAAHRLQKFIADMVSERVVDALELIDIDIEQRELLAADGLAEFALDLLAEQYPVRKVGQRVVMRQMRDLLVGKPALGNVVDDVDDVPRLTRRTANSEPFGGDVARAHPLGFPDVLVLEQAVGRLQRFLFVGGDDFGGGPRKDVGSRLADDQVARNAELGFRHAVDQQIAAVVHVLHGNLGGDVIDDLAQEGVIAVALLLEIASLGDIFHGGNPAAIRQRLSHRQECAAVGALDDTVARLAALDVL
ncbi:hypothetical protein V1285_004033 [Bradyrhizobium sp. AZCC 1620]